MQNAPGIIEIAEENETFKSGTFIASPITRSGHSRLEVVARQFKHSWRHTTACPKVRAVYKITSSQQNLDKYNAYR